jgi:hypothetical protein
MTTSPPQVNGHKRPAMPVLGDWQAVAEEKPTAVEPAPTEPKPDPVAEAEADAIRTRAYAEAEAQRIAAEAAAEATRTKAKADAEKQRLANERTAMATEEKRATHNLRMEEIEAARAEVARQNTAAREQADAEQQAEAAAAEKIAAADDTWKRYAIAFYAVCAVVALPVQVAAFWDPQAWWLVIAPLMLEGAALVVTKGAAAAVAAHRPHWHYRTVTWMFAFIAAGINLWHGMAAFDPATAIGTAFASLAGPGVWDLHEHGRIRRRDGALTRRERKALKKAEKKRAAEEAAAKLFEVERQAYRENAVRQSAKALDDARAKEFSAVHQHALKLAADLGETTITEAIWKRAKLDVDGALPGESAEILRMRNAAERRVAAARENTSVNTLSKTTNAQRANQMPRTQRGPARKPPVRRRGDTPKYSAAARKQAAITARITAAEEQK